MRKLIILLLTLFLPLPIFASFSIGFDAGYSMGLIFERGGEREARIDSPGHFFTISVPISYEINNNLSINSGIRYSARSYEREKFIQETKAYKHIATNHYIELPLTLRIVGGEEDGLKAFVGVGGYIGILFLKSQCGYNINILIGEADNTYSSLEWPNTGLDNLFSAGILFENGVSIAIDKNFSFTFVVSYYLSLTNSKREYRGSTPEYLDSFSANLGMMYRFGGDR